MFAGVPVWTVTFGDKLLILHVHNGSILFRAIHPGDNAASRCPGKFLNSFPEMVILPSLEDLVPGPLAEITPGQFFENVIFRTIFRHVIR